MLFNFLKVTWRNIRNNRLYSFINILGLAVGLSAFLLIVLYVSHEWSYDTFPPESDRIYRVTRHIESNGNRVASAVADIAPMLENNIPEYESVGRISGTSGEVVLEYGDRNFNERRFFYAEPEILQLFGYPFVSGDPGTALSEPNTVVITRATARKYFGEADPMGKTLILHTKEGADVQRELRVTGVVRTRHLRSHFTFDFLASFSSLGDVGVAHGLTGTGWTYVRLAEQADLRQVEAKSNRLFKNSEYPERVAPIMTNFEMRLQPLARIHLYSDLNGEIQVNGSIVYVTIFSLIALLILMIACINYMNLTTARSVDKAREIGVRKSLGASRRQVAARFLGESMVFVTIAMALSLLAVEFLLPYFNDLMEINIHVDYALLAPLALGLIFLVSGMAGLYPSLFLSATGTIEALKGRGATERGNLVWKGLTVFQFVLSISLIISALVINQQTQYLRQKNLGFEKEQLVYLEMDDVALSRNSKSLRQKISAFPGVISATRSYGNPTDLVLGSPQPISLDDRKFQGQYMFIDPYFVETLGIRVTRGRSLDADRPADANTSLLVNEAFVREMGWDDPVGKTVPTFFQREGGRTVVGVVEDFHYSSLREEILPVIMLVEPRLYNTMTVRLRAGSADRALEAIHKAWSEVVPYRPFDYTFVDQRFEQVYRREAMISKLFWIFTGISIFIACMGLLGLSAHYARQRTKELGIRKVLGAGRAGLLALLSRDFLKLVLVAYLVSIPIAWYATNQWLADFAYRIEPGAGLFLAAGISAMVIALVTISWQAWKAVRVNPVECLRTE